MYWSHDRRIWIGVATAMLPSRIALAASGHPVVHTVGYPAFRTEDRPAFRTESYPAFRTGQSADDGRASAQSGPGHV